MSDSGVSDIAAIFDFDGVLFHPDSCWKIQDVRLGRLGSRVRFQEAFALFQVHQKEYPDLLLTDCFALDEFEYATAPPNTPNVTPPSVIAKTAQNHLFRGHDLIFFSFSKHRELQIITEPLIGELRFPILKNPFERAIHLYPQDQDFDKRQENKFQVLRRLLRKKNQQLMNLQDPTDAGYVRLHLYYTDTELALRLKDYVRLEQDRLTGGRNAVTLSQIARV